MAASKGYDIKNKTVVVTGANRGIGKALVEAFVAGGAAKVYAGVRTLEKAQPLVEAFPNRVFALHLDLADKGSIEKAAKEAQDVQIVVNNAGILNRTNILNEDAVSNLQKEMDVNVYGFMHVARIFAPILKQNGGGALVQVNSVGSMRIAVPEAATYAATKAAAFHITQALRTSLREQDTFVMSVHPGPIATEMIQTASAEWAKKAASTESTAQEIIKSLEAGDFLCFPDPLSKKLGEKYQPFAEHVFEKGNAF